MKYVATAVILTVVVVFLPEGEAYASPTTPDCARVEYRTEHLQECNRSAGPGFGVGGGRGDGRGLLGGILHRLPGVGGLF